MRKVSSDALRRSLSPALIAWSQLRFRQNKHLAYRIRKEDVQYTIPFSTRTAPILGKSPGEWVDIDTSYADTLDIGDVPTPLDTKAQRQAHADRIGIPEALPAADGDQLTRGQAAKHLIQLHKQFLDLDFKEHHIPVSMSSQHSFPYQWADLRDNPRRMYFTARHRYLDWREKIFPSSGRIPKIPLLDQDV
jgi:hypothetical protein